MKLKSCLLIFMLTFISGLSNALADVSPEGNWKTIDDKTNKPRSIMKLWVSNGVLNGKVIKVFPQPGDKDVCEKCPGNLKGQPILGLPILSGLRQTSANVWDGGKIIEPKTGNVYTAKLTLSPDGNSLQLKGYLGVSMLGRNQTWLRVVR